MKAVIQAYSNHIMQKTVDICNQFNESHQKWIIIFAILYKFSLDIYYIFAVSPIYAYEGMELVPSALKYLLSAFLYFFIFSLMPKNEKDFASFFLNMQFVIILAPMLCTYALNSRSNTAFMLFVCACVLLQIFILKKQKPDSQRINVYIKNGKSYTIVFSVIFIAVCMIVPILYNGFAGLKAFDFVYIYVMRSHAEYPPLFGYFLSWATFAVIPFFIIYSLSKSKYFYSMLLCIVQLIFYVTMGHKNIFLILLVIIGIFIIAQLNILTKGIYLVFASGSVIITVMALLEKSSLVILANSFWGERFLFGPAINKFRFYEVFSQYPPIYFADGLIGKLFSLPYIFTKPGGFIVFAYYNGGNFTSNSNTGYWGDSYAQLGFLGILLMSVLLAYIIKFIDNTSTNIGFASLAAVFSVPIVILNDGALLTTLLTSGMLILIFLVFIFNEPSDKTINGTRIQRSRYCDNCVRD